MMLYYIRIFLRIQSLVRWIAITNFNSRIITVGISKRNHYSERCKNQFHLCRKRKVTLCRAEKSMQKDNRGELLTFHFSLTQVQFPFPQEEEISLIRSLTQDKMRSKKMQMPAETVTAVYKYASTVTLNCFT